MSTEITEPRPTVATVLAALADIRERGASLVESRQVYRAELEHVNATELATIDAEIAALQTALGTNGTTPAAPPIPVATAKPRRKGSGRRGGSKGRYPCPKCGLEFAFAMHLARHAKTHQKRAR